MLNFSKSVLLKKQTHLHLGWPEDECICCKFSFLDWTFPLKIIIFYGFQVADIKRVNNLFQEQDMYALKSIKIPVKKHGLLTEANSELRNPQQRPSNDVASSDSAEANVSGRPQVQEYTNYLKEVDSDIERLIQSTDPSEEVFSSGSRVSKRWGWRSQLLRSYGADWGIQWWNAVIAMLLIGIVLPIFYVVYFKTQDNGESVVNNRMNNITVPTSNSTGWASAHWTSGI